MKKYTVVWLPRAQARLTYLWINAPDQQAVADASDQIDLQLAVAADRLGIPVRGAYRTYAVDPLAVLYEFDPGDCMVGVIRVWRIS
jgi:hypothetical protein